MQELNETNFITKLNDMLIKLPDGLTEKSYIYVSPNTFEKVGITEYMGIQIVPNPINQNLPDNTIVLCKIPPQEVIEYGVFMSCLKESLNED